MSEEREAAVFDLRAVWDEFLSERVKAEGVTGPSPTPIELTIDVQDLHRHLEARGLRGFDLIVSEHGAVVLVPKIRKLSFTIAKVPS